MNTYYFVSLERADNGTRRCDVVYTKATPEMPGKALLPEELVAEWQELQPCFDITVEDGIVTALAEDPEGREMYDRWVEELNNQPDPEPEPDQPSTEYATKEDVAAVYDELAAAFTEGVNSLD